MGSWKMRQGDTRHFALELELRDDPSPVASAPDEHSASWGAFQVWVDGQNLCSHYEMGESLESVHWYLLPLIEWWAEHWDAIFHEERLPHPARSGAADASAALAADVPPPLGLDEDDEDDWLDVWQAWWRRHAIRSAREGGIFPDIVIRRWRDQVEVSWGPNGQVGAPDHFRFTSSSGHHRLDPEQVAQPVHALLVAAVGRLREQLPESERLARLAERLDRLPVTPRPSRLAWMAGLDPLRWQRLASQLEARSVADDGVVNNDALASYLGAATSTPGLVASGACQAALMWGCLAPTMRDEDLLTLARLQLDAYEKERPELEIDRLARSEPSDSRPWEQAYALAEDLLGDVEFDESSVPLDLDRLFDQLGIHKTTVELSDREIRGVAFVGPDYRPTVATNSNHQANQHYWGLRLSLGHELCHLLFDRGQGRSMALASGPWTSLDVEQRANAFAAMLLMPTSAVREWLSHQSDGVMNRSLVKKLATHFQVGFQAALEHLCNLGFVNDAQRQGIDAEIGQRELED